MAFHAESPQAVDRIHAAMTASDATVLDPPTDAVPLSVPFVGGSTTVYVSGTLSGSLPVSVIETAVSSGVLRGWSSAVGGSLAGMTEIEAVAVLLSNSPSLT